MNVQKPDADRGITEGADLAPTGTDPYPDGAGCADEAVESGEADPPVHGRGRIPSDEVRTRRLAAREAAKGRSVLASSADWGRPDNKPLPQAAIDADELKVRKALDRNNGKVIPAAKALGVSRQALQDRIKRIKHKTGEDLKLTYTKTPFKQSAEDRLKVKLAKVQRYATKQGKYASVASVECISKITRLLPGGKDQFLESVKMAHLNGYEAATKWWNVFDHLTLEERAHVNFDDICVAASVTPGELLGYTVMSDTQMGRDTTSLVTIAMMPEVVVAAGQSAKRIQGSYSDTQLKIAQLDRHAMLQHSGFLPRPGGTSINVNANANVSASAQAAAATVADPTVPRFAEDMASLRKVQERVQTHIDSEQVKMLPFPLVQVEE